MAASATDALGQAMDWTGTLCFRPFSLGKWLVLGFCAFLASLGQGGLGATFRYRHGPMEMGPDVQRGVEWVETHAGVIVLIGVGLLLLGFAFTALFLWLSSRGEFMLLDGVVHDRAAVKEPWKRLKAPANSLFKLRLLLAIAAALGTLLILAVGLALAWPDLGAGQFGSRAWAALLVVLPVMLPAGLVFALVQSLLTDFIVPTMYTRQLYALPACRVFWRGLFAGNVLAFVVFYLLKIVLSMAAGLVILLGTCVTCCIAGLPYISSVAFLPITVFFRSYPLFFLAGFGPEWDLGMGELPATAPGGER